MCPECGQVFNTKKEVDTHIRKVHELICVQRRIVKPKILEFFSFSLFPNLKTRAIWLVFRK